MSSAVVSLRGLHAGGELNEPRPGAGHPAPPSCACGLFHRPTNHDRPVGAYCSPDRCNVCSELRCDAPRDCRFPHRAESRDDYYDRVNGT